MADIFSVVLLSSTILLGGFLIIRRTLLSQITVLAGLYLIQALLFLFQFPILFPIILLILGWMVCAVMGAGKPARSATAQPQYRSETLFYMLAYLFAVAAGLVLVDRLIQWFPLLTYATASIGLVNIFQAVIVIGFSKNSQEVIIGLLLLLAGFEIIFLNMEISLLVIGLMGGIKLGLAFIASFWMGSKTGMETL